MSAHRIFAQIAFETALGNAALDQLRQAVNEKQRFEADTQWPKEPSFGNGYDIEKLAVELDQIVQDRLHDVLTGPGLRVIERGELFHHPEIAKMVLDARDRAAG